MKKAKAKQDNKYKIINAIFACIMIVMAGVMVYCGLNMKTAEEKEYLALQDHLYTQIVETKGVGKWCEVESHGLSKDNDVYVRFWCYKFNPDTNELTEEKVYNTLYFQKHTVLGDGYSTGYAEALGD
ncbi:MAG: hypothetical protein Q4B34_01290 [Candidatus Saccharibacteria bacterium]|nr:hypothetical protein [Candidatus Saccharibacteria bacterium]